MLLAPIRRKKTGLTVTKYQPARQPNLAFDGVWFSFSGVFTLADNTRRGLTAEV
jgi:hypothetical protein